MRNFPASGMRSAATMGSGLVWTVVCRQWSRKRLRRERKIQDLLPDEEEAQEKTYDGRLVKRLMVYVAVYRREFVLSFLLIIVTSVTSVATPWMIQRAIDYGIRAGNVGTLRFWTFLFLGTVALEWITSRARLRVMAYAGTRIVTDLRSQLFGHLHTLSLGFFNDYSVGRLMSRLISDVSVLQDFVTWSITGLARSVFLLIGIVVAMLFLNWQLALVTFAVLPDDDRADQLFPPLCAPGISRGAAAPVADQRFSQRVDHRHPGDEELFARAGQLAPFRRSQTVLILTPMCGPRSWLPSSSPVSILSARWRPRWWLGSAAG